MLAAGIALLRRYLGMAIAVYAIQLAVSGLAALVVAEVLAQAFAHRPMFDRAIDGDLPALIAASFQEPHLLGAAVWIAVGAVIAYWLLSWVLAGGVIATYLARPYGRREVADCFGRGAAGCCWPYARLAVLSIVAFAPAVLALAIGARSGLDGLARQLSSASAALYIATRLGPAAVLYAIAATAVDFARIDLARHPGLAAWRALLRAFRLVLSRASPLAQIALYWLFFASVSAFYAGLTFGKPLEGAAGLVSLLVLRQAVGILRLSARLACIGGQIELSQTAVFPPRR